MAGGPRGAGRAAGAGRAGLLAGVGPGLGGSVCAVGSGGQSRRFQSPAAQRTHHWRGVRPGREVVAAQQGWRLRGAEALAGPVRS